MPNGYSCLLCWIQAGQECCWSPGFSVGLLRATAAVQLAQAPEPCRVRLSSLGCRRGAEEEASPSPSQASLGPTEMPSNGAGGLRRQQTALGFGSSTAGLLVVFEWHDVL